MRSEEPTGIGWVHRRGGRSGIGRFSMLAILIGINLAVFLLQYLLPAIPGLQNFGWATVENVSEPIPWGWTSRDRIGSLHLWTLVTYAFVHGGVLHILLNLILIFFCGKALERMIGGKHLLGIYLIAAVFGGLVQIAYGAGPLVGASAAAYAFLIAIATLLPEQRVVMLLYFILPVRLRLKYIGYGVTAIAVIALVLDLILPNTANIPGVTGIGHAAHLGGALVGWLYIRMKKLGGIGVTRESLQRDRERSERRKKRSPKRPQKVRTATVSAAEKSESGGGSSDHLRVVESEVDEILDKMNREGVASLSKAERKRLEEESDTLKKDSRRE